ncbi:MAG TPA: M20/M25/M40 family metallo-hydrolase [Pyrinomonadaceae bacterium]|nr:M20/M25/M40 family metallo-hydrolase [Pyrinomonadaceae bacterium]
MKRRFVGFFLLAVFVFQISLVAQTVTKPNSPARKAAEQITAEQLKDYLYFIADDAMQGRDTPSPGLDATANFIAFNLKKWGFKPAGDNGTYLQKIALRRDVVDPAATKLTVSDKSLAYGDDFFRWSGSGTGNGSLVYAKDGWMVKSKGIDALSGLDVTGKIVVIYSQGFNQRFLTPIPAGLTQRDLTPATRGTDWADPVTNAKAKGAVGVILVAPPNLQANWAQVRNFFRQGGMFPEKLREATPQAPTLPVLLVSGKTAEAIFQGADKNPMTTADAPAAALKTTANFNAVTKAETAWTQNVVALWEGGDPKLKDEMVAIGAHYDHVGVNPNAPGDDKIFNGADDDGSGTTGVLGIAEALAKSKVKPKRSILFVWHCGEEKGLWGSEYFNKFPTVDIKKVTAQLNIDMIGRSKKVGDTEPKNKELSGENEIFVIGSNMMSSTLGKIVADTNNNYLKMTYDFRFDDPKDPNRFFFRSDHFNYAVNGIPISFWFDGVHVDYHQASDSPDKIDYKKMEKISRTIFLTMWELADLKERPKIDKQLPPELTQR